MIYKLLSNFNYLIYFFAIFVVLLILTYLIYKIFIIDNDLFILNEKVNKMEIEFSSSSDFSKSTGGNFNNKKEAYNLTEIIMNEVFNNDNNKKACSGGRCKVPEPEPNEIIDIDNIIKSEVINSEPSKIQPEEPALIFDLKKEVVVNDNESVVSGGGGQITKKRLLKLNLDKLKEKCTELNLSTEGTKAQLIDRICEEINKDV